MGTSIAEIARQAGVSRSLVSRLLNGDPTLKIAEKTRQKILAVHEQLGGVRRPAPLVTGWTRQRACRIIAPVNIRCTTYQANPPTAFRLICQGIQTAGPEDIDFRLNITLFDHEKRHKHIEELIHAPDYCNGLVLFRGIIDASLADMLLEHHFPHVCLDRRGENFGVNTLDVHISNGIRQAVSHLAELGHKHIIYMGRRSFHTAILVQMLFEHNLPILDKQFIYLPNLSVGTHEDQHWRQAGYDCLKKSLDDGSFDATAVFCHNDPIALGAIDAITDSGRTVGKDISVVGCDHSHEDSWPDQVQNILTTIESDPRDIGRRCRRRLMNQIVYQQMHIIHERIPSGLIVRKSTGPVRT